MDPIISAFSAASLRLRRSSSTAVLALAVSLLAAPTSGSGQVQINSGAMQITLGGRVHSQYNTTSVPGEISSMFVLRRARITATVIINDIVSGRVQPDFADDGTTLRDAYVQFRFDPWFRMTAGKFKRSFDLFELTSSTETLVIERAGDVRGADGCAGPSGVCSLSRLTEKLQFADRDVGVRFDGTGDNVSYQLSITNGTGTTQDLNGTKSYSGRVSYETGNVTLSGNAAVHDFTNQVTGEDEYAPAFGADIEIGNFSQGLHVQAGVVGGSNWGNLDAAGGAGSFTTAQGIITYKSLLPRSTTLEAVEPVARLSFGNPDTGAGNDGGVLLTPGLALYFIGRNKIAANVDIWVPAAGGTEYSLKLQSYLHF